MAEEKFGVENIKKLLKLGFGISKQIVVANEDGKFTFTDALGFVDEISEVPGVAKSFPAIADELKDLSAEETTELNTWVASEFDIPNDKTEKFIELGLKLALTNVELVNEFRAIKAA